MNPAHHLHLSRLFMRAGCLAALVWLAAGPALAAPAAAPGTGPVGWQTEIVSNRGESGHTSALALAAGQVHLVFWDNTYERVRYAHWGGLHDDWQVTEVAAGFAFGGYGVEPSPMDLALDRAQAAHVVYENDSNVMYTAGGETGFDHFEVVGHGHAPAVAATSVYPMVSFVALQHDQTVPKTVVVATPGEAGWEYEAAFRLPGQLELIKTQALALDRFEQPHLAVQANTAPPYDQLYYAHRVQGAWEQEHIGQGWNPAIAADFSGRPYIAYSAAGSVWLARLTASGWVSETVALAAGAPDDEAVKPAVAIGPTDTRYVAFVDAEGLKVATYVDGGWLVSLITAEVEPFSQVDLAVDAAGQPHVSYQAADSNTAHAVRTTPWRGEVVDARAPAAYTSIDASHGGQPRISYALMGGPLRGLNLAAFEDFGCAPPACSSGWNRTPVALNEAGDRGYYSSVELRGLIDGDPRIASYNPVLADLEYSFRTGSYWQTETVDSAGDVGRYADLELDGSGQPWIAYWDNTNYRIRLAWKDPAGWHLSTNTAGPALNALSGRLDLALPLPDSPVCCAFISYHDGVNDDLRLARWDGGYWSDVLVASSGQVGSLSAIDFAEKSYAPYVALYAVFYDSSQQALMTTDLITDSPSADFYAYTAVPAVGSVLDLSELVTSNHYPHLAVGYTTAGDNGVHVATGILDGWQVDTVDSGLPAPPRYVSLDRSPGRLHASYVDATGEMVYAASTRTQRLMDYNPLQPCLEEPEAALAALANAPAGFRPLAPAAAADASDLDVLRAARDLFATDPDGQHYITLYYTHAAETGVMALADAGLALEAYDLIQDFLPGVAALASGQGQSIFISQGMVDRTNRLADRLAAAGSPALADAIAAERARYNGLQDFAGLNFDEAAALIGVPAPRRLYLPVVSR